VFALDDMQHILRVIDGIVTCRLRAQVNHFGDAEHRHRMQPILASG
jgi:hypothetical protein